MMQRFLIFASLLLVVGALSAILIGGRPIFAQEGVGISRSVGTPLRPAPAAPAVPQSGMPVPAEMQELLADRDLLSAEIDRIINAEGEAVKIPVSLRTLSARREAKTARFLAWLDAQKIPREWGKAGWKLEQWIFIPPASVPAPSAEKKKE